MPRRGRLADRRAPAQLPGLPQEPAEAWGRAGAPGRASSLARRPSTHTRELGEAPGLGPTCSWVPGPGLSVGLGLSLCGRTDSLLNTVTPVSGGHSFSVAPALASPMGCVLLAPRGLAAQGHGGLPGAQGQPCASTRRGSWTHGSPSPEFLGWVLGRWGRKKSPTLKSHGRCFPAPATGKPCSSGITRPFPTSLGMVLCSKIFPARHFQLRGDTGGSCQQAGRAPDCRTPLDTVWPRQEVGTAPTGVGHTALDGRSHRARSGAGRGREGAGTIQSGERPRQGMEGGAERRAWAAPRGVPWPA